MMLWKKGHRRRLDQDLVFLTNQQMRDSLESKDLVVDSN
jgi:hypothetical protein